MRPLLLLSSLLMVGVMTSCQNKHVDDETKSTEQTERGGVGERREAPPNDAPDQEQIDSLKQEKLEQKFETK